MKKIGESSGIDGRVESSNSNCQNSEIQVAFIGDCVKKHNQIREHLEIESVDSSYFDK